jgi:hypothetical protein
VSALRESALAAAGVRGIFTNLIDGKSVGARNTLDVLDPATGELLAKVPDIERDGIDAAFARGPVPTRMRRRISSGWRTVSVCAMYSPIEKPSRSICESPSAPTKSAACSAIASIVSGVSPLDEATPALSNRMTGRFFAKPSVTAGFPMIHSASKMLHEKKRRAALLSEPAVGEANPVGFNELRGGRDVSVCHGSFCSTRTRQPGVSPGAILGETLRLSYGPVVLTIAALCYEDKNPSKTDALKNERCRNGRDTPRRRSGNASSFGQLLSRKRPRWTLLAILMAASLT